MKRSVLIISLISALMVPVGIMRAQVVSDCTPPSILLKEYERDIKNLAVRRMYEVGSADTALVRIPAAWTDSVARGLAAILNARSLPERDSVFNLYCVHDNSSPGQLYHELLIGVDGSYGWTSAWKSLQALTGNPLIDTLVVAYSLGIREFYDWSFGSYALITTDSLWNIYALMDEFRKVPGVRNAEPNALIGTAGRIMHRSIGDTHFFDFFFEFNDCFDGCDNHRRWSFRVNPGCTVDYLGYEDWGVFGISGLPVPVNCNIFNSSRSVPAPRETLSLHPNPSHGTVTILLSAPPSSAVPYAILDTGGRRLMTGTLTAAATELATGHLAPGLYMVKAGSGVARLVIQ